MNKFTTPYLRRLRAIRLSSNERLRMREQLALYTQMHPVPAPDASVPVYWSVFGVFASRNVAMAASALALILVVGSSVSFAAEGSAPGDSLYALKIKVNEPLMTAFSPTATGQAKVAAKIATRRVDEAVTLASRGTLTPERQAYLADAFDESVEVAAKRVDDLASTGDAAGAANAKASLAVQLAGEAQALGAVSANEAGQGKELLRVVVATTESISGTTATAIAVAETEAPGQEATATEQAFAPAIVAAPAEPASPEAPAQPALMAAKVAVENAPTTTPVKKTVTGRFTKRLHATTTLEARLKNAVLSPTTILLPKIDVAIPRIVLPEGIPGITVTGEADHAIELER